MSVEPEVTGGGGEQVAGAVEDLLERYLEAIASLDVERIASFYDEDPRFVVHMDGHVLTREALVGAVEDMCAGLERFEGKMDDLRVIVLDPETALAAARFQRTMVPREGEPVTEWGTVTWVCVLRPEGWRYLHGHGVHLPGPLPE